MATLKEYFDKDFSYTVSMRSMVDVNVSSSQKFELVSRLHLDFSSKALFASFYLEEPTPSSECITVAINELDKLWTSGWPAPTEVRLPELRYYPGQLQINKKTWEITSTFYGGSPTRHDQLTFTGRIYLYVNGEFSPDQQAQIKSGLSNKSLDPQLRGETYRLMRDQLQTPLAFISHDSRDKSTIARPIAIDLQSRLVPVWYDEFSLPVGAKLRESIEGAIKTCKKCILVVTKNFISNSGWTKAEFDSVFTKEIIERGSVLLPVWHGVTARDVYDYSSWLANIKAAHWEHGQEEVVKHLHREILGR